MPEAMPVKGWRKFTLASVSLIAAIIGVFTGTLSGVEFNYALALILGLYGGSNVVDKMKGGAG